MGGMFLQRPLGAWQCRLGKGNDFLKVDKMEQFKELKIYTAGEMQFGNESGKMKWREDIENALWNVKEHIIWLHPEPMTCDGGDNGAAWHEHDMDKEETTKKDLALIDSSDIVIAYLNKPELYGTITEIMYALSKNKKIIVAFDSQALTCRKYLHNSDGNSLNSVENLCSNHTRTDITDDEKNENCNICCLNETPYWFLMHTILKGFPKNLLCATNTLFEVQNTIYPLFGKEIRKTISENSKFLMSLSEDEQRDLSKREPMSKVIRLYRRNQAIIQPLKDLYSNKCQICDFTFKKKDDSNYSETHHLIPLGENGSDDVKNLVVLCPNCHKKLHFATTQLLDFEENKRKVQINGNLQFIKYIPEHFKIL